jgi:hypothetical protein
MMQSITTIKVIVLFLILILGEQALSQNPVDFIRQIKEEFPEDNFVQLSRNVEYLFLIKNGQLEIQQTEQEKYIYLKNVKTLPITLNTYNSSNRELLSFEAFSQVASGNKYKKIRVTEYNEKMNVDNRTFYDDIKELTFTFPGITEGTIIELNTVHKINDPRLLSSIFINSYIPIRDFRFKIKYDKNISIDLIKMNFESYDYTINQSEQKKFDVYECSIHNVKKIIPEDFEPDYSYFIPHVIPIIRGYSSEGEKVDILNDTKSLHNWYYSFISNFINNEDEHKEIKQITDSLIISCKTEKEKVKKLYYWVQNNIKYISFEYGMGGFIPRDPEITINNRYGDCKDKAALLYSMLKIAGIKSYFTWIGTYDIPYSYDIVSSPIVDNHMILTYISEDQYYFLDGTGDYLNINTPNTFIQGKEALISIDKDNFKIQKVPVVESYKNKISENLTLTINENEVQGSGVCKLTGYHKLDLQHELFLKNVKEQEKIVEENLEKGNNKFVLKNYSISDLNTFDTIAEIKYSFVLNDYIKTIDSNLYINLNLDKDWLSYKLKKDRKNPVFLPFCTSGDDIFKLQIPDEYIVTYLPENYSYNNEALSFNITYSIEENTIVYHQKIWVDTLLVESYQFENWNSFIKGLEIAYKQTILLKKNGL